MVATLAGAAHATTVAETMTGTIAGYNTVDTNGYFGPPGTDLKGALVTVSVRYVTEDFNAEHACLHYNCTEYLSVNTRYVPKSVRVAVTVNGVVRTFAPAYAGEIIVGGSGSNDIQLNSDAGTGADLGIFVHLYLQSQGRFGAPLNPLLNDAQNWFTFTPANSQAEEVLNFSVQHAAP